MTDRYAVFGNPLSHTKSPMIHGEFAKETTQDLSYTAIEIPLGQFNTEMDKFRKAGGVGGNVTAPFKLDAFAYADEPTQRAKLAGAVNTLYFHDGKVFADNTDGIGLLTDIESNLGVKLQGKRVLILGAGGATRGAILPFLNAEPKSITLANRTLAKATAIYNEVNQPKNLVCSSFEALQGQTFDVVINATSASLSKQMPDVPLGVFANCQLAYDLAYGKGLTPFLAAAKEHSAQNIIIADGVGMLVEQAAAAFRWWRGVNPSTQGLIKQLTIPLV
ncbi:MAG: shikimate dehydrogenase [Pontibacterium sp.]